jgi:SnoaL-like domain
MIDYRQSRRRAGQPAASLCPMLSDRFRTAVETGEIAGSSDLFREDAVFPSPVVYRPYAGRDAVLKVLEAAEQALGVGGQFRYVHQLEDSDARVAILEFATEVDGRQVEGIDKPTFDEDGRIAELKLMLRPASALQVVGARMAEEFARLGLASRA